MMIMPIFIPVSNEPIPAPFQEKYGKINAVLTPLVIIASIVMAYHLYVAHNLAGNFRRWQGYSYMQDPQTALSVLLQGELWEFMAGLPIFLFGTFALVFGLMYSRRIWPGLISVAVFALTTWVVIISGITIT